MTSDALKIAAVAGFVALAAFGAYSLAKPLLTDWKAVAKAEEQVGDLATETTKIIETTTHNTRVIERQANESIEVIKAAPGADDPVPPDVLDAWRNGLDSLRDEPGAPDDQRP
jgi:hypothetical protein